jgi:hypothetical protein
VRLDIRLRSDLFLIPLGEKVILFPHLRSAT